MIRGGFSEATAFRLRLETLKEEREVQFSGQRSPDGTAKALKMAKAWHDLRTEEEPM